MPRLQTHICTLLGGSSRLEHPTTPSMHQVLQRTPCQTKRRIASCRCQPTPNLRDGCRVRASVIAKRLMWGQPAVTPASPTPQTLSWWSASPADVLANEAHHIFTNGQWRRACFLNHPEVKLTMSVNASDYQTFRRSCPTVGHTAITAMADTGAQSCLWSMTGFLAAGFTPSDLIPVSIDLVAANKSPIKIAGAIILRLQGHSPDSEPLSCATMVYVSEAARVFYLS